MGLLEEVLLVDWAWVDAAEGAFTRASNSCSQSRSSASLLVPSSHVPFQNTSLKQKYNFKNPFNQKI